jgi:hypothetical protein
MTPILEEELAELGRLRKEKAALINTLRLYIRAFRVDAQDYDPEGWTDFILQHELEQANVRGLPQ